MSTSQSATTLSTEPSVSHLIIFNPDLKPSTDRPVIRSEGQDEGGYGPASGERDKDLEDDMKEACQILFYTSRSGGKVSRDTMLRQFGLAKGLMGFSSMVLDGDDDKGGWWSVHSQKSRMIIYSPEVGFYIYLNVTLGTYTAGEISHASQGLLDRMIVDGLKRGYEDFRLLHGPLPSLIPPSPHTSLALDRFWTKFAFQSESIYLSPSDPGSTLSTWLGGYSPHHTPPPAPLLLDDKDLEGVESGLIGRDGPLHPLSIDDASLVRYLHHQLRTSLPATMPPTVAMQAGTERSTLGLGFGLGGRRKKPVDGGGRKDEARAVSSSGWSSWVPSIGLGLPRAQEADKTLQPPASEAGSRWPSFGLSGVGTVFGLGKSVDAAPGPTAERPGTSTPTKQTITTAPDKNFPEVDEGNETIQNDEGAKPITATEAHHVEQSEVAVMDLQEAVQAEDEIELSWHKKDVWLKSTAENGKVGGFEKRRLASIIRDETLLFVLYPRTSKPPYGLPSTPSTLAVFASLIPRPRPSTDSTRPSTPVSPANAHIYHTNQSTTSRDMMETGSLKTLTELKDCLSSDSTIEEVYARTSSGRFVVAKKTAAERGELYLQVSRKDASLTDAEHAVRSVGRAYPEMGG